MSKSVLSRRQLVQSLGSAFAIGGGAALASAQSNTTAVRFQWKKRIRSSAEVLNDPDFSRQGDYCYLATESGPNPKIEIYNSIDEMRDAYRGSALYTGLGQIKDNIQAVQAKQDTLSSADIRRLRRQYEVSEADRQEIAAEAGVAIGSEEFMALSFPLPRWTAGTLWEHDNFEGRSTGLIAVMPDAALVGFDNIASSLRFSGLALFSDLSYYRGSKLFLPSLTIQSVPSLGAYQTPHGVSWNDLISSWTVVSF